MRCASGPSRSPFRWPPGAPPPTWATPPPTPFVRAGGPSKIALKGTSFENVAMQSGAAAAGGYSVAGPIGAAIGGAISFFGGLFGDQPSDMPEALKPLMKQLGDARRRADIKIK